MAGSMSAQEMTRLAGSYFDRVARGDRAGLLELMADDLRWVVPRGAVEPFAGTHVGAEHVVDMMLGSVGAAFKPGSQKTAALRWIPGDDLVVLEARIEAEATDGRRYENDYAFFFEFRDGRISEIREYVDTRTAALFFGSSQD